MVVQHLEVEIMPTFLMKCPSCGKHFEVHRTGEEIEREHEVIEVEKPQMPMSPMVSERVANETVVEVSSSLPADEEVVAAEKITYTETYTCRHCGHTWTEQRTKFKNESGGTIRGNVVSEGAP